jgi:hypothetical protein
MVFAGDGGVWRGLATRRRTRKVMARSRGLVVLLRLQLLSRRWRADEVQAFREGKKDGGRGPFYRGLDKRGHEEAPVGFQSRAESKI